MRPQSGLDSFSHKTALYLWHNSIGHISLSIIWWSCVYLVWFLRYSTSNGVPLKSAWVKGHGHWKYSTDEFDSHHVCAWEFLCVLRISLNYGHLARVILRYSSVFSRLNSLVFTCRVRRGQPVTVPPKINHFVIRRACWHLSYRWLVGVERHFQASTIQRVHGKCAAVDYS